MLGKSFTRLVARKSLINNTAALRAFGAGGHGPKKPVDNGLQPVIQHPDGHDDHHHGHIVPAGLDHRFMESTDNQHLQYFNGSRGTSNAVVSLDNQFHQLNGLPLLQ